MKTAFLFPGQGAQLVGMGKDLADAYPQAKNIYQKANNIVGFDLQKICFEGPREKLDSTAVSQPAIFTTSAAILEVMKDKMPSDIFSPDLCAGLSLGEYSALYAAGIISFTDALKLVAKRGSAMQHAAQNTKGSMVSIIGLDEQNVAVLCRNAAQDQLLVPVNFNCPGQIVISGHTDACDRAVELAEQFGALKAVKLAVAGAFHTDMMAQAADQLALAIKDTNIKQPASIKVIANINAEYYTSADQIAQSLLAQLTSPILWQQSMEKLIAENYDTFYEIGPSRVLTGLMRRINRKIKVTNISTLDSLIKAC